MPTIPKYKNWQDFKLRNDPLSNKQKGDRFEVFTKLCLEIHPTDKTQLKHVWLDLPIDSVALLTIEGGSGWGDLSFFADPQI